VTAAAATPFRILVVCTGNICRSPQAERLLTAQFERRSLGGEVEVSSAGVAALVGRAMEPQAAAQTIGYGGNPSGHLARRLEQSMVEAADLVLTMERAHRADVVRMVPRASRYTFTLPEFARLAVDVRESGEADVPDAAAACADRLRAVVPQVAAQRGQSLPAAAEHDEIDDPYGRSDEAYARSGSQVAFAVFALVDVLVELASPGRG
jgi:protein-tyrosine phosphatase